MASQVPLQRSLSNIEKAMLEELGSHRLDDLPMDDGRFDHQANVPLSLPTPQGGPTNKWREAIADGAFDDDDAIQVAGMESIADGQLARIHRASRLAGMMVTIGYDDQRLRRGPSGQIDPRAQFRRAQKGPYMASKAYQGDGPVQVPKNPSDKNHVPAAQGINRQSSKASVSPGVPAARRGPAPPGLSGRPGNTVIPSTTREVRTNFTSTNTHQQKHGVEPAVSEVHKPGPLVQKQQPPKDIRTILPEGASIIFQTNAELASPTFIDKKAKFPGTVYLISGRDPSDDQIMLRVEDERVEDVKRSPREYDNLLTQTQEVILQFKTVTGRTSWYVVRFMQRDDMVTFVDALRNFVDQSNQATDKDFIGAISSAVNVDSQATVVESTGVASPATKESGPGDSSSITSLAKPLAVHPVQPSQTNEPPTSDQPLAAQATITSSQQQDDTPTVPANLVEDIVAWVMNIVVFIRETGPPELARFDALPGIIRGAAAAVLLSRHPDFAKLDHQQRVAYIDECCAPQVFDLFKRRLREQAAQGQSAQTLKATEPQAQKPQDQTSQEVPPSTPSEPSRIVYTAGELTQLRSVAMPPPHWLTELGFLKEATRACRQHTRVPGLEWDEAHDAPMPDYKSQIQQIAASAAWLHNGRAPESPLSSSQKGNLIGLFVTNVGSDAEVIELLAAEDQVNIIRVLQWSPTTMVVKFMTIEDRDGALQRVAGEFKTRSQDRSKPFVDVFRSRERIDSRATTMNSADGTGSFRGGRRSSSSMNDRPTHTTQTGINEAVTPSHFANVDDDMAVGSPGGNDIPARAPASGATPSRPSPSTLHFASTTRVSPSHDSHITLAQLTSSQQPQAPDITGTAPGKQDNTVGASSACESLIQWDDTEQQGPKVTMTVDTEIPTPSALDEHIGLNASRFNLGNDDLLGETSGSWTGALAKNKSYMDDLRSIL